MRNLVVVLGDQLDRESAAFDGFDRSSDRVWMAEAAGESTYVWSHKARIAIFLAAMRHFRDGLDVPVEYRRLNDAENTGTLEGELRASLARLQPQAVVVVEPGEYRIEQMLRRVAGEAGVPLEIRPDRHFLCSKGEFAEHAKGKKKLLLEFFYRWMRQRSGVLMEGSKPAGGDWNFDTENRKSFPKTGPAFLRAPVTFAPDETTAEVLRLVEERFPQHPGRLAHFDWPVTRAQALQALEDFVRHRLPLFGQFQDAMWTREPYLYHSRISAGLNLKLLRTREVLEAAENAYRQGHAPIASVEGFVRQILGWREYVRGVYWQFMPGYEESNALEAHEPLPGFYWDGETEMNCLREAIGQTLDYGYAQHIQRLMVTGLYALLLGVEPRQIHEWYLAVYIDAVEWVEMPNVIGMSQFADGGKMSTKPYIASGKYVQRMSNYCAGCRYDPAKATGAEACPFTTLYWDFLDRHEAFLAGVPRMEMQLRNLRKMSEGERAAIRAQALRHVESLRA
ncbi:MAG: cryptochrome/photolyase family protein [Bryobacterales bacterium]|nr:cryptochrome/photolyase family protein [Bryobacterales bacterium]